MNQDINNNQGNNVIPNSQPLNNNQMGVVNNGDLFLRHFNNKDTTNVRKSLELILQNDKQPKTVSEAITSETYEEPI